MPIPATAFIEADWPAPDNILALCTTRQGGSSAPPFDSFNLALHVGDDPASVQANREVLSDRLPEGHRVQWLEQVHGTNVIRATGAGGTALPRADAAWCDQPNVACTVMTADCLPVLFCSADGRRVAASHAGWRGLAAGVLEASVSALDTPPEQLMAWLGPAIGPMAFEVGSEVRDAFLHVAQPSDRACTSRCFSPGGRPDSWFADLYGLARLRLRALGVSRLHGGGRCTFTDSVRFFSYRRDGQTGRMASLVMILPSHCHT